ncbi:MAG: M1 family metallopeptidase [Myxococcota bacterium]
MIGMLVLLVLDAWADDGRLHDPVRPTSQRVHLALDPASPDTHGQTTITLDVSEKITGFSLHAHELTITSAAIGRPGKRAKPAAVTVGEAGLVRIDAGRKLKPGAWSVQLAFDGQLHDQTYGLYRFQVDGSWFVASQFEANDARTAWPCFDEPAYKVPFELVVDAPTGLQVIGNAPIVRQEPVGDGTTRSFLQPTPPVPSYAEALLVGPYVATEVPGMKVPSRVYTLPGREELASMLVSDLGGTVDALETWFGRPQPYAKLDWILVPEFTFGAMENPGAIVAAERFLPAPAQASPDSARFAYRTIAHEVAHYWFGDLVTMRWWDDLWLNESFADWLSQHIVAERHPELRDDVGRVQRRIGMLSFDAQSSSQPLRTEVDPTAVFETSNLAVYAKGEALLDTVEAWVGAQPFRDGLQRYLAAHEWGNATAEDLFAALTEASGEDVTAVMLPYLDHPGAPLLQVAPGEGNSRSRSSRWRRRAARPRGTARGGCPCGCGSAAPTAPTRCSPACCLRTGRSRCR